MKKVFLLSVMILVINAFICAQISNSTKIAGRWAVGAISSFTVENNIAYSANGGILLILNIENPYNPKLLSQISTKGIINDVAKSGNYIYLAEKDSGLIILDVSNLSNPVIVYELLLPGPVNKLLANNNTLFIIEGQHFNGSEWLEGGFRILDISNPINPEILSFYDSPNESHYLSLIGNYIYIENNFDELLIVDISDLKKPLLVRSVRTRFGNSYLSDNLLYVASNGAGLKIFDVSDPTFPLLVEINPFPGGANDIVVSGDYAFMTTGDYLDGNTWKGGQVRVFNISEPTNSSVIGGYESKNTLSRIAISGNTLIINELVSNENILDYENENGLRFLSVSNPSSPQSIGFYNTPNLPVDVVLRDSHAFVLTRFGGLNVVDIHNASNPVQVGYYNSPGTPEQVVLQNDFAYLADGHGGLRIVDISDLTNPVEVGSFKTGESFNKVDVSGNYAFVLYYSYASPYTEGMYILDISDPLNILQVSDLNFRNLNNVFIPLSILVNGDYVYLGDGIKTHWGGSGHIWIYNISDISNPIQVGEYYPGFIAWDIIFYPTDLALKGNNLFIANSRGSLDILDVSDPTNPVIVSNTPTFAENIEIDGNFAYLTHSYGGLKIFDITDPMIPKEIDTYNPNFYVTNIDVNNGEIYVSASDYGMMILHNDITTGTDKEIRTVPDRFILNQNYPNPFNPVTIISYTIPSNGFVSLKIYDILGNEISTLVNSQQSPGQYEIDFTGENLSSGIYLYILKYNDQVFSKKMVLLK